MRGLDAGDQGFNERMADEEGNPLYLFLADGRPATDSNGTPLRNIAGTSLVSHDFTNGPSDYQDWRAMPLTDSKGRLPNNKSFCPTLPPFARTSCVKCASQVFSMDGLPLTDVTGIPLVNIHGNMVIVFSPKGHPVMDLYGKDITDKCGRVLYQNEKPFLSKDGVPLRVYDDLGRPLTDDGGYPFTNLLGMPLIRQDEQRNPVRTYKGYNVNDAEGNLQGAPEFDLTKVPRYYKLNKAIICKNKEHGLAFDFYGHPLTDMDGFPLFDLKGTQLVKKKNKVWLDINGEPVTIIHKSVCDRDGLAHLRNGRGTPVRLYDTRGYPLTDHEGTPMVHATGIILIRFNENGEPICDSNGDPLFDDMGNRLGTASFCPCKPSNHNEFVANYKGFEIQFFEATGMPLTNVSGVPLLNNYQELLAVFDSNGAPVTDAKGRDVYDILGLPIVRSFSKPLLDPTGDPIRLYSKSGKPLTDRDGYILKSISNEYLLKLNFVGQIVSDSKGGPLFDSQHYEMRFIDKFLSSKSRIDFNYKILLNLDGSPLCMYDISGEPLTDARGGVLMDYSGKNLITTNEFGMITEKNGHPAYDLDGYTAVRVAGRAVSNKIAVYDSHDRPLIGPSGFILKLRTGRELLKFDRAGNPRCTFDGQEIFDCKGQQVFSALADIAIIPTFEKIIVFEGKLQLFACDDRPLLDITGEILYTSRGVPLLQLDNDNIPKSDYIGRPVYDDSGIPVANPGGLWKDPRGVPYRLFDKDGLPLTDSRGKELFDINGISLVKRDEYGHPKYDMSGTVVYDALGHRFKDIGFVGTAMPPENKNNALFETTNKPLRLYDLEGKPLTDERGVPLQTVKGDSLFHRSSGKIVDRCGRTVYDSREIPLGCDPATPIVTMKGTPMMLYNLDGSPLVSHEGMPIKCLEGSPLLSFDEFGRPFCKSGLYNSYGVNIDSMDCTLTGTDRTQQMSSMPMEGCTVRITGSGGRPITDNKSNIVFKSDANPTRAGSWGDFPI